MSDVTDHRSPTADCYMDASAVDTNRNVAGDLKIGTSGKGANFAQRPILEFDVSVIPAGATIDAAKLRWYCSTAASSAEAAKVYRCSRANWVETQVTWNSYSTGNAWTAAGGDYDAATPTPVAFNIANATGWQELTGLAALVTDALANRSGLVELILRVDDETVDTIVAVYGHRTDGDYRPSLIIEWTSPTGEKWVQVVSPAKDTRVSELYPTTNYGSTDNLRLTVEASSEADRILAEFSLSAIPAQARLVSARFTGHVYSAAVVASKFYRLTREDWVEAEATWNIYKTGSNWTAAGGDYDAAKYAAISGLGMRWLDVTITTLAQDAINARQRTLELLGRLDDEDTATGWGFTSKEHTEYADPYVVIQYEHRPQGMIIG